MSRDIVGEILKRVDGPTLANAACSSSDFLSFANEEWLWENMCISLWPSTNNEEVKQLISSLGGFRKFYGDCFPPLNADSKYLDANSKKSIGGSFNYVPGDYLADAVSVCPSDFVSLVDLHYDNKPVFSKIIEGDCMSHHYCRSFLNFPIYPFVIDLFCSCDGTVPSITIKREEDVESETLLLKKMKLSWIMINTRTKHAVNLSSWRPQIARKNYWGREGDFTVGFGSLLVAAHNSFPLELVSCNITVNCRLSNADTESMKLQISEISLHMEDEMGNQLNARDGVLTIQKAMKWGRRMEDYNQFKQRYDGFFQNNLMEEKRQATQGFMYPIWLLFSVAVVILSCYYCLVV
ncbi:probable F-box protein At2g36090 [Cryptomeria japonica]|uniref:probable F-box protein At2g36090 n=1 Tax=Cryptomeria japonica TaxID=3369 RepID=UPI0027D9F200|nr:probable F-box protein At2g36090 [Cryptomeria japonica]